MDLSQNQWFKKEVNLDGYMLKTWQAQPPQLHICLLLLPPLPPLKCMMILVLARSSFLPAYLSFLLSENFIRTNGFQQESNKVRIR